MSRSLPADVSASRVARADWQKKPAAGQGGFVGVDTIITLSRAAGEDRAEQAQASRHLVRIMVGAHGCPDLACTTPQAGETREDVTARHPVPGHGCQGAGGCALPGHVAAAAEALTCLRALQGAR